MNCDVEWQLVIDRHLVIIERYIALHNVIARLMERVSSITCWNKLHIYLWKEVLNLITRFIFEDYFLLRHCKEVFLNSRERVITKLIDKYSRLGLFFRSFILSFVLSFFRLFCRSFVRSFIELFSDRRSIVGDMPDVVLFYRHVTAPCRFPLLFMMVIKHIVSKLFTPIPSEIPLYRHGLDQNSIGVMETANPRGNKGT